jgi:hypothetical protein
VFYNSGLFAREGGFNPAVLASAGAYAWVVNDLISRSRQNDIVTSDINSCTLRLFISIPLAYAISAAFQPAVGTPLSFFLGAFPTDTLFKIMRRQASKTLGDVADAGGSNIEKLQQIGGINVPVAERLVDEGISTIVQLAYCDPVSLSIRAGKDFSFILDLVSQALAVMNMEDDMHVLRKRGLRGAQEIRYLIEELSDTDEDCRRAADAQVESLAEELKLDKSTTLFKLRQVSDDPYALFTWNVWGH